VNRPGDNIIYEGLDRFILEDFKHILNRSRAGTQMTRFEIWSWIYTGHSVLPRQRATIARRRTAARTQKRLEQSSGLADVLLVAVRAE